MRNGSPFNQDFFKVWTPEIAYVLGYFAADGSMIKNRRGAYYIEFTSTDKILLENLTFVTNSLHKIATRPLRNEKWKTQYRIQIGSKKWFKDLEFHGLLKIKAIRYAFR
jgi:hypothetical protein